MIAQDGLAPSPGLPITGSNLLFVSVIVMLDARGTKPKRARRSGVRSTMRRAGVNTSFAWSSDVAPL